MLADTNSSEKPPLGENPGYPQRNPRMHRRRNSSGKIPGGYPTRVQHAHTYIPLPLASGGKEVERRRRFLWSSGGANEGAISWKPWRGLSWFSASKKAKIICSSDFSSESIRSEYEVIFEVGDIKFYFLVQSGQSRIFIPSRPGFQHTRTRRAS